MSLHEQNLTGSEPLKSGLRKSGLRESELQESGLQESGLQESGLQESGLQESGLQERVDDTRGPQARGTGGQSHSTGEQSQGTGGQSQEPSSDTAPDWTQPEWKILSLLLSYPGDASFSELLKETAEWAEEIGNSQLIELVQDFRDRDVIDLESEYIQYFDFQSNTCLYLTAHELGDSRKRGVALVALRRMLAAAGWEQDESELPDYLPLLFEFLAAKSAEFDAQDVEIRLGRVCKVIVGKLPAESVYRRLFEAAADRLPDVPIPENGIVFTGNETTDLDELPYPVFYE